jgi:AraC family transcriptional regulator of adaptative response/methylated-DNA-[protein]-cysteine methyltransferase
MNDRLQSTRDDRTARLGDGPEMMAGGAWPQDPAVHARHYAVVERAIEHIRRHAERQPSLQEVADAVGLSPHHLQRVFTAWAGLSPKRFLQHLTREAVKQRLRAAEDVLQVADETGLSSGSRVHDLMVTFEAVTPGEYKSGGRGLRIGFGFGPTPFGRALIGWTARGICHLVFVEACAEDAALTALHTAWPNALLSPDDDAAGERLAQAFAAWHEVPGSAAAGDEPPRLLLRGTRFQIKVWEALIATRPGELLSYGALARRVGLPQAARAVGGAMAANTIAALIPCHRVLREGGELGHYRWGVARKAALIVWEAERQVACQRVNPPAPPT